METAPRRSQMHLKIQRQPVFGSMLPQKNILKKKRMGNDSGNIDSKGNQEFNRRGQGSTTGAADGILFSRSSLLYMSRSVLMKIWEKPIVVRCL